MDGSWDRICHALLWVDLLCLVFLPSPPFHSFSPHFTAFALPACRTCRTRCLHDYATCTTFPALLAFCYLPPCTPAYIAAAPVIPACLFACHRAFVINTACHFRCGLLFYAAVTRCHLLHAAAYLQHDAHAATADLPVHLPRWRIRASSHGHLPRHRTFWRCHAAASLLPAPFCRCLPGPRAALQLRCHRSYCVLSAWMVH